jgi:hypothetical protein
MYSRPCRPQPNPQSQRRAARAGVQTLAATKKTKNNKIKPNPAWQKVEYQVEGKPSLRRFKLSAIQPQFSIFQRCI